MTEASSPAVYKKSNTGPPADPGAMLDMLAGGGEMGERIRAFNWSGTPLGAAEGWPQSLKTSVSLILGSRHPMWIGWGPEMTFLYNDAYLHVLGMAKHPWALGRPAAEVWAEIWDVCGPLADRVFHAGEAAFVNDVRLFMDRGDRREETFYSFSYSPIRDESGKVAGLFCPSNDVTPKILNARRLKTLSELAARALVEKTAAAACATAIEILAENPDDIPYALLYLTDADGRAVSLQNTAGLPESDFVFPLRVEAAEDNRDHGGLIADAYRTSRTQVISVERSRALPGGLADRRVLEAVILPVTSAGYERPFGVLIAGVSPTRTLDAEYRTFYELAAGQIATAIQNATAAEAARKHAEMLAEMDRVKTTFFSNVSHEFRTPLTLALGPLEEALTSPEMSPRNHELVAVAHRNSLRLLKLVNSLLDFSRIEAGRIQARYEPLDLATWTAEICSTFRSAMEKAGLQLVVDCPPLPVPVYIDREMWEKIVLNLLSNAFKFTLEGSVRVTLSPSGGFAELEVRDTGAGIPAGELPRLFDRFHRVEGSKGRTHEGSGIGLALVQELVKAHGGTVSVASELGKGSVFTVRVPWGKDHLPADRILGEASHVSVAARAEAYVQEALRWLPGETRLDSESLSFDRDEPAPGKDGIALEGAGRYRILLAEDNADMRDYVRRLLSPHMEVTATANGREALTSILENPPDLVLSDVMMPVLDGFALLKEIRANPQTATLPVIILSARAGEESRVEGVGAGADDYLVKPFSARELLARVSAHLKLSRLRRESMEALGRANAELRRVNEDLNQFAYSASHDLQEPLRNISIFGQLLKQRFGPTADEEINEFVGFMIEGASRMETLLRDLLAYTQIASSASAPKSTDANMALRDALKSLKAAIAESGAEIVADELPVLPVDGIHLHQLFQNLIGNALKYRDPARPPRVRVAVTRRDSCWQFVVEDNGIGIAPDYHQRVFGLFKRLHSADKYSGTGIGLAIAQKIVQRYGGQIWVESELGKGAAFFFTLPAGESL